MRYRAIDLCAGIGGIRRGFEMTGHFETVLSAEIDRYAAKTYKHLFGDDPTNDMTSDAFKSAVEKTDYDVLLAGFPCQAFSRAGKQEGFQDQTRGTLFYDIQEILDRTRPSAFFLENVDNLLSHDGGKTIEVIINVLEKTLDYKVIGVTNNDDGSLSYSRESFVRNTKDFGLPQNRPRAYIMGFDRKRFGDATGLLEPSTPRSNPEVIFPDIDSVLEDDPDIELYISQGYLDTLKRHKAREKSKGNGFGYVIINSPERKSRIANAVLATGGSGKERNLVYQPKEGVAGKKLPSRKTEQNNEGIRMLSPNEWAKLQGFKGYGFIDPSTGEDTFSFPDGTSRGQQYKQLGNSVSIPVIRTMADFMFSCLSKMSQQ